ncbi:MAG: hypothetical protein RMY34_05585 [Aulosira sp. DedQUE10]|nr:hypothetical protein [Aulosira sp. DedQUE10]
MVKPNMNLDQVLGFVPQTPLARLPGNPSTTVAPQPTILGDRTIVNC